MFFKNKKNSKKKNDQDLLISLIEILRDPEDPLHLLLSGLIEQPSENRIHIVQQMVMTMKDAGEQPDMINTISLLIHDNVVAGIKNTLGK